MATGIQLLVLSIWPYLHSTFGTLCQPLIHSLPIMAPVQLPPPVLNNVINLPQQPHDPLRNQDIIESIRALKGTKVAYGKVNFILIVGFY